MNAVLNHVKSHWSAFYPAGSMKALMVLPPRCGQVPAFPHHRSGRWIDKVHALAGRALQCLIQVGLFGALGNPGLDAQPGSRASKDDSAHASIYMDMARRYLDQEQFRGGLRRDRSDGREDRLSCARPAAATTAVYDPTNLA